MTRVKVNHLEDGGNTTDAAVFVRYSTHTAGGVYTASTAFGGGAGSVNFSAGTTSGNLAAVTFANGGGVSFGLNAGTITASHDGLTSQSNQAASAPNGSFTFQTLEFANSNNVTWQTVAGPRVAASIATSLTAINLSAGTTSANQSAFTFGNAHGISFGLDASTITASHNALTSQSNQALSAANGSFTFQTATFADSNGISFSTGTQGIFASHNALTSQSNQAASASNGSFTFQTLNFSNANNVTFGTSAGGIVTASVATAGGGLSAINVSAGTTSNNLSALTFSNSGSVSFGLNGSVITASVNGSIAVIAGTGTKNAGLFGDTPTLQFSDANGISWGFSGVNPIVTASIASSLTAIKVSAGAASANLSAFTLSNSNNISFGLNASTITALARLDMYAVGNTTQSSSGTQYLDSISFRGAGGASVGVSNGSVVISAPSAGGGANVSYFEPAPIVSSRAMGQGTYYMQRVLIPAGLTANVFGWGLHISNSANAGGTVSHHVAIFTRNVSTWSSASSSSGTFGYNSTAAASSYTRQSGTRIRTMNIGTWNITPGDYMIGLGWSVVTSGTSGSYTYLCNRSAVSFVGSMLGVGNWSEPSAFGVYSAATNSNPAAVSITQINQTASAAGAQPWFILAASL